MRPRISSLLVCLLCGVLQAAVLHVPGEFASIQSAIDAAAASDTLLIEAGDYYENLVLDSAQGEVTLLGAAPLNRPVLHGVGSVRIADLDHFNGAFINLVFEGGVADGPGDASYGGALKLYRSSPLINNCDFLANTAASGGAIFLDDHADPVFTHCRFEGNSADTSGGAVFVHHTENSGAADPDFEECVFSGNWAGSSGGAFHVQGCDASLDFHNSIFWANEALNGFGGAVYGSAACVALRFHSSTLCWNTASFAGGAISVGSASILLDRCILAWNWADEAGGIHASGVYSIAISCSDLYDNNGYSDPVPDLLMVNGNFSEDPYLDGCDTERTGVWEGWWPTEDSPCTPLNNSCCAWIGARKLCTGCESDVLMEPELAISFMPMYGLMELQWNPVTHTVSGCPVCPTGYQLLGSSSMDGPWTVVTQTADTQYLFEPEDEQLAVYRLVTLDE